MEDHLMFTSPDATKFQTQMYPAITDQPLVQLSVFMEQVLQLIFYFSYFMEQDYS